MLFSIHSHAVKLLLFLISSLAPNFVNKSAISCDGNVIVVNGEKIGTPIVVSAIGPTSRLSTLERSGGTLEMKFRILGKTAEFKKINSLTIPKYTGIYSYKYAKTVE